LEKCYQQATQSTQPDAWLFWDGALGAPDPSVIEGALDLPGDLWHAGLRLGMGGLPGAIDFVAPVWMLNRDPGLEIEATSWRLSLRACLVRHPVIEQMGFIQPEFHTLEAAALEWGHRCISQGVIVRHVPALFSARISKPAAPSLPFEDELRFVLYRFGRKWVFWTLLRAVLSGYARPIQAQNAWRQLGRVPPTPAFRAFQSTTLVTDTTMHKPSAWISVLIPTLERYTYLRTLLAQLRQQTQPPVEIIVVDQTDAARRQPELVNEFKDLPVRWFYRSQPGQCSSRNAGLEAAQGDLILFLDDDDEAPEELIAALVASMQRFRAQVISGVAEETGAGPLPQAFTYARASDVFPTNITLVQREALRRSGLFDLAYEHGARADGDLGMRVYLSGALMVLDPAVRVIHHHAASGGLRAHKARVVTYSSSRRRLTQRRLASASEFYLARRYFSFRQVHEMAWLNILGTFSLRAGWGYRLVKAVISLALLPDTVFRLRRHDRQAREMLRHFPSIPRLEDQ
jgi:glycosyltransferase involved in cell wall biosynthesis